MSTDNLIQFPSERIVRRLVHPEPPDPKKTGSLWRLADLCGGRPDGHPNVERDEGGRPVFAVGQVWVEISSTFLWAITAIYPAGRFQKCRVRVRPYKVRGQFNTVVLLEVTVRGSMRIWDDTLEPQRPIADWLNRMDGSTPSLQYQALADGGEDMRSFLGVDKNGDPIE